MEYFLTILSGFLVPAIACITVYVVYQQYKIEKDKFKLNLYDRRLETFQSLMDLLEYINRKANISNEELNKFAVAIDKGYFLFDSKINDYLSEVRNKCIWLSGYVEKMENLGLGEERNKLAEEKGEAVLWLLDQFNKSKKVFEKYLKMDRKNRIKTINYRQGLDRFYSILTLVWFFAMYFAFFSETLSYKVNPYTNNLVKTILGQIFVLAVPFVAYIILILVFKIFLWIINGFQETGTTTPRARVKIFAGEDSFFNLIKKYRILVLGIVIALILIRIFISFTFTSYNSYEERQNALSNLQFNFGGLPLLPKLPSLKIQLPSLKLP